MVYLEWVDYHYFWIIFIETKRYEVTHEKLENSQDTITIHTSLRLFYMICKI